ncbi:hypothetical protein Glove_335g49 [Diversispora epigaea]|uniref:FAR1 domain-containing protein n=1 Tax=Diversispora epigaea TaxID=1348612 RepID=A0A397HLA7_9GLOM|nr:hypothetical protein Glove_335g49 [Diversispora epigaea]
MNELNYFFHNDNNNKLFHDDHDNNELFYHVNNELFYDDHVNNELFQVQPDGTNSILTINEVDHENLFCDDHYIFASASSQLHEITPTDNTTFNIESDESNELDDLSDSLELISGLTFSNWEEFKTWIHRFTLGKGFNYKIRTSEIDKGGVLRRATYECTKSGSYNPQVTSDPTKRRNVCSQQTQCSWKLNVTCPKTSGIVKINLFINNHNYPLTPMIYEIALRFRKLSNEMLADIEKYVVQGRMDSASIYPLLRHDYPGQTIYKRDLYNAVYQFCQKNSLGDADASQMLQQLLE